MKKVLATILLCLSTMVQAGPFVEVGLGYGIDSCLRDYDNKTNQMGCSDNPLGNVAIGWRYNGFTAQVEHFSSLIEKDKGFTVLAIKYRYEWKLQ